MKKIIRLTESDLHRVIKEAVSEVLNEVEGYNDTMQKAGQRFNQNTMMGRLRSRIAPKKYQQYQNLQQQGQQMAKDSVRQYNAEADKLPMGDFHDHLYADYGEYAKQNGLDGAENGHNLFDKRTQNARYGIQKYGNGGMMTHPSYRGDGSTIGTNELTGWESEMDDYKSQK